MTKKITSAKIWLPYDEDKIKVQQIIIENMIKNIGDVSIKLGAKTEQVSGRLHTDGRLELLCPTRRNNSYKPGVTSFYGKSKPYFPAKYLKYTNEHPIIKILLDGYYNGRISYFMLANYLLENSDFDWAELANYYNAITLKDWSIENVKDIQTMMNGRIEETAHGYSPIGGSYLRREYREHLVRNGEWMPSCEEIREETEANKMVLKRVFKKNL